MQEPCLLQPCFHAAGQEKQPPTLLPFGAVVRFRAALHWKYNRRGRRTATSEVFLLLGRKKLGTHVVVVFWAVSGCPFRVGRLPFPVLAVSRRRPFAVLPFCR